MMIQSGVILRLFLFPGFAIPAGHATSSHEGGRQGSASNENSSVRNTAS